MTTTAMPGIAHDHEEPGGGPTWVTEQLPALLTVPRTARLLGISRASAYRYAASGELPVRRLGGRVYVVTARLLAMLGEIPAA